jgi:hypothetical protein
LLDDNLKSMTRECEPSSPEIRFVSQYIFHVRRTVLGTGASVPVKENLPIFSYHRMGIVTAARAVYRAGKATLVTGTILVKVIFVTIMSYRNFSGTAFYYIF